MIVIKELKKRFNGSDVLRNINLRVRRGEAVALVGPSGSGKTTLIRAINGFVVPDSGTIMAGGKRINCRDKGKLREIRKSVGMIYQLFNLVERRSVLDNVMSGALGRMDRGMKLLSSAIGLFYKEDREKAMQLLGFVGIENKAHERADRLSGGQKQRVAIARALMQEPEILLADEPIANLDPRTSSKILELLLRINMEKQITLITVLHHIDYVKDNFSRVVAMRDGAICFDGSGSALTRERINDIYEIKEDLECLAA
ncbi:MAG TPA: phosphonate ABC transporter ATP-binding protein [Nitrospirae bacterium]|nr:phosphonate ABC transporter ATP-binding protein [Nitrospirota bacterium]